ncbi:MAG: hypothetical protein JOZ84_15345 [Methylobacteriaceae bacterium]|jgi:hypothetical protein|nr:hypothetical protein [Methylobacteriaceae bacterium]MBV9395775.1 hypothetical protein [Methylobacteriaceae bacterium]
MGALSHDLLPGAGDINAQFLPGTNIHKTLALFKRLYKNGTYTFGTLTAAYNGWAPGSKEYNDWMTDLQPYTEGPSPTGADKIVQCISGALKHLKNGAEDPLQVKLQWGSPTGPKDVTSSFDPKTNIYTINISGYPVPK